MVTIHLILFVYIHTLFGLCGSSVTNKAVPSIQLLPDDFLAFDDYDVLSVHEEGEEDVVHIRKRVEDENCENDCLDYSGWYEDGVMHCDTEDGDAEDSLDRRSIMKRGRKPLPPKKTAVPVCQGVMVDGLPMPGFYLISPTWPEPPDAIKVTETKKTTSTTTESMIQTNLGEPLKPEWFKLVKRDSAWTQGAPGSKKNRCYHVEHVLEWQLLSKFLEQDKDKGDKSLCVFIYKYYLGNLKPKSDYKVKVAKKHGELDAKKRFDYEDQDYDFTKWKVEYAGISRDARPIDYVSHQWPGTAGGSPPNPWEYELVILQGDVNNKKENVWGGKKLFPEPMTEPSSQILKPTEANSKTLEAYYDNKYYEGKQKKDWPDNMGRCKAIHMFQTLMTVVQYHNDPYIREVMRAQVNRVGEAWHILETEILKDAVWTGQNLISEKFQSRDLRKKWREWMVDLHKKQLDKLQAALDDKIKVFEGKSGFNTKLKRWDYSGSFRRDVKEPKCGSEKNQKNMERRVELLVEAYNKQIPRLNTELKLD